MKAEGAPVSRAAGRGQQAAGGGGGVRRGGGGFRDVVDLWRPKEGGPEGWGLGRPRLRRRAIGAGEQMRAREEDFHAAHAKSLKVPGQGFGRRPISQTQ